MSAARLLRMRASMSPGKENSSTCEGAATAAVKAQCPPPHAQATCTGARLQLVQLLVPIRPQGVQRGAEEGVVRACARSGERRWGYGP